MTLSSITCIGNSSVLSCSEASLCLPKHFLLDSLPGSRVVGKCFPGTFWPSFSVGTRLVEAEEFHLLEIFLLQSRKLAKKIKKTSRKQHKSRKENEFLDDQ